MIVKISLKYRGSELCAVVLDLYFIGWDCEILALFLCENLVWCMYVIAIVWGEFGEPKYDRIGFWVMVSIK